MDGRRECKQKLLALLMDLPACVKKLRNLRFCSSRREMELRFDVFHLREFTKIKINVYAFNACSLRKITNTRRPGLDSPASLPGSHKHVLEILRKKKKYHGRWGKKETPKDRQHTPEFPEDQPNTKNKEEQNHRQIDELRYFHHDFSLLENPCLQSPAESRESLEEC